MKVAGGEERRVAEPEDLGKEDQEQQRAEQHRNAHVGDPGLRRPVAALPAGAPGSERDPVKQRVQRQQHEVMGDDRTDEPRHDPHRGRPGEAVKPADNRGAGNHQAGDQCKQVQRACSI